MLHVGLVTVPPKPADRLRRLAAGAPVAFHVLAAPAVAAPGGPCLALLVGPGGDVEVPDDPDRLWHDRLAPFARNLAEGRRAPRRRRPVLAPPDPTWPAQAARLIARLQHIAGDLVRRIDHIGSTAVPGLPAKDLVDIQVVVDDLAVARRVASRAPAAGFVPVGTWTGTDSTGAEHPEEVVVDADPGRPVNVNVRPVTGPVWQEALRFRDHLRDRPAERAAYAALKQQLAAGDRHVDDYSDRKLPWIAAALARVESSPR